MYHHSTSVRATACGVLFFGIRGRETGEFLDWRDGFGKNMRKISRYCGINPCDRVFRRLIACTSSVNVRVTVLVVLSLNLRAATKSVARRLRIWSTRCVTLGRKRRRFSANVYDSDDEVGEGKQREDCTAIIYLLCWPRPDVAISPEQFVPAHRALA